MSIFCTCDKKKWSSLNSVSALSFFTIIIRHHGEQDISQEHKLKTVSKTTTDEGNMQRKRMRKLAKKAHQKPDGVVNAGSRIRTRSKKIKRNTQYTRYSI